jgi:hypothetical protein
LHASKCNIAFKECTDPPYNALKHQDGLGVTKEVAFLLDRKTPMLFFNGQYDMICNHVGVEKALDNLAWSGKAAFNAATLDVWMPHGDKPAGYARSAGSLTLLLVLGSGHMVPMDKPPEALDMLRRFIRHKGLGDAKQSGRGVIKPRAATVSSSSQKETKGKGKRGGRFGNDTCVYLSRSACRLSFFQRSTLIIIIIIAVKT